MFAWVSFNLKVYLRTESILNPPPRRTTIWKTWLHYKFRGLKSISLFVLLSTWELQRHYWKRWVVAHIIAIYCVKDGKGCSCVTQELQGKGRWSRSLSVSRPLVFQKAVPSHGRFCPPWGAEGSSEQDVLWGSPTRSGSRSIPAESHCASVPLPLFQPAFMSPRRLTVAHLYPAAFLYSRGFFVVNLWLDYVPL